MDEVAEVGYRIFLDGHRDPRKRLRRGAVELVIQILGPSAVYESVDPNREVVVHGRCRGVRCIGIRRGTPPRRANFLVAKGLAMIMLERYGMLYSEDFLCRVAAWLVAPPEPFLASLATGASYAKLARTYSTTESLVILRVAEEVGPDAAVFTPDGKVYPRGHGLLAHLPDEELWKLVKQKNLRYARRQPITDEQGRIALIQRPI